MDSRFEKTCATIAGKFNTMPGAASVLNATTHWMDQYYDKQRGLLIEAETPSQHVVRGSIWYALGVTLQVRFLGREEADLEIVQTLVREVLTQQFDEPGTIYHGTFRRAPQEAHPGAAPIIWQNYDPNWRQFIGTVLVLLKILEGHRCLGEQLPAINHALKLCIEGEPPERVSPAYTNIALMRSWLELETLDVTGDAMRARGLTYAAKVQAIFARHLAFAEYNSPTYYGINLFALGLWCDYSEDLHTAGEQISRALWQDISRYYHGGLHNLCGPWSRSYGMDMQEYVAALGLWIWAATNADDAPVPQTANMRHAHDYCLGPLAALSITTLPDNVIASLTGFTGDREIHQVISSDPRREAHAWLGENLMIGIESAAVSYRGTDQYHHLTVHWQHQGSQWLRLRFSGRLDGEVGAGFFDTTLNPDDGVTHATLEFSSNVVPEGQGTMRCSGALFHFDTSAELLAEGQSLRLTWPRQDKVSVSCRIQLI